MVGETATRELAGVFPNEIIRASAGTGKTFALSNRYLKLLASGAECQTILATTFTKKGAGEILDRIINRLSDAALSDGAAAKLSQELEWNLPRERAAKVLHELLGNLHRLEIGTLDSFFNRVAKAFALELRLPPTWEIVDEQEMHRMQDQAIQTVLHDESVLGLLHMLTKGEATRRVASMVRETVEQIYDIYRESGPEPWDRLKQTGHFLSDDQLEMVVAQIEAVEMPGKQLAKHWEAVKPFARIGDWAGFVSTTSFQRSLDGEFKYSQSKLPPDVVEIYQTLIPHCRAYVENRLISQNKSTSKLLQAYSKLIEKLKDETGNLRFDDVTERLQEFVSVWDTERFAFRLDHQIQHLLLDEFQDTSLAQWNVIRPFASKVTQSQESLRSFFCVGDMKQAIFGWRGGVAEIFNLVDDQLPNLDSKNLSTSYRSSPVVIDLINEVFLNVDKYDCDDANINDAIHQWPNWFEKHTTQRTELTGHITIEMASDCDPRQRGIEDRKDWLRNQDVIRKTVKRIKKLVTTVPDHHSIGVVVRTNSEVSELIFALQQRGIPASEEGGSPLTDSAAVETVLSAIQLADHPGDSIARFHLSHSPLAQFLELEPETKANQREMVAAGQRASARLRSRLISEGFGPTIESLAREMLDQCTRREILRIQQLVRIAYESASSSEQWHLRPGRFVQFVRDEVKVSDQSSARVRVMTIHKAKGLEFDVVVLPLKTTTQGWAGFTPSVVVGRESPTAPIEIATRYMGKKLRKLLPQTFQALFDADAQRNVRESMCVLYVALTRAVHSTHIIMSYGAKPDHKSQAGLLLATLCPNQREEGLLYERGDPEWYRSSQAPIVVDPFGLEAFYLAEDITLRPTNLPQEIRSGRGVPRTSPSRLEGGQKVRLGNLFETHDNHAAKTRGKLIHCCFEQIKWLDDGIPKKDELRSQLANLDPTIEDFGPVISAFHEMIKNDNVQKLLSRAAYQESYLLEFAKPGEIMLEANRLEVHNERRFAVSLEAGMLQGVIDRLVLVYQGNEVVAADVIDFKSDAVTGTNLQEHIEFYRPQLAGYRQAVSQFVRIPLDKISTRIVFVESGTVVNVDLIDNQIDGAKPALKANRRRSQASIPKPKSLPSSKSIGQAPNSPATPHRAKSKDKQQQTFWD